MPEKVQLEREFAADSLQADSLQIAQLLFISTSFGCSCG